MCFHATNPWEDNTDFWKQSNQNSILIHRKNLYSIKSLFWWFCDVAIKCKESTCAIFSVYFKSQQGMFKNTGDIGFTVIVLLLFFCHAFSFNGCLNMAGHDTFHSKRRDLSLVNNQDDSVEHIL